MSLQYSYIDTDKPKLTKLDINKTRKKPSSQRITNDYIKKLQNDMTKKSTKETDDDSGSDTESDDDEIPYLKEEQKQSKPPSITKFQPPPMPSVQSKEKTVQNSLNKEQAPDNDNNMSVQDNLPPMPTQIDDQASYDQQYLPSTNLKQFVPYYNNTTNIPPAVQSRDELVTKLNYLIHMLEEQQEQKTGHVMEELILYCFLGVFIIYVIDSFVKIGKYTR